MKKQLYKLTNENKEIFWDVAPEARKILSEGAIFERILEFGDLQSFKKLLEFTSKDDFKNTYKKIINKDRKNLSQKTINFVNIYLEYHS